MFTAAKRRPRLCGVLQVSGGDLRKAVTTLQSSVRLGGTQVSRWVQDAGPVYAAVKVGVCTYTCMFDSQDNGLVVPPVQSAQQTPLAAHPQLSGSGTWFVESPQGRS